MARQKLDLAALAREAMGEARDVSISDTVERIAADLIETNEANFYEMSDLEELAASIELVGLLHPVIVKRDNRRTKPYILIDGERRFRAMTGVLGWTEIPCLVRTPVNEVIEELMLIEANRQQRKMSAGDLSKQAERYTELLAQLKGAGVEIPGRLRDRVAEAMQVSASKLARLHAIRQNLEPGLLQVFDDGDLSESVAYELSKFGHMKQVRIWDALARGNLPFTAENVLQAAAGDEAARAEDERKTLTPSANTWDSEEYLRQRQQEDEDFYLMLGLEAKHFLAQLAYVTSRQDGIQTLKEHFGRDHSGWYYDEVQVNCSMKGVELGCEDRAIPFIERTWTDVYDMLSRYAFSCLARFSSRSNSDTPPAGIEWHKIDFDHKPLFDFKRTVLLWGPHGLRNVPQSLIYDTINVAPETVTHWAVIDGPEEEDK